MVSGRERERWWPAKDGQPYQRQLGQHAVLPLPGAVHQRQSRTIIPTTAEMKTTPTKTQAERGERGGHSMSSFIEYS